MTYSSIHPILESGSMRQRLLGPILSCRLLMLVVVLLVLDRIVGIDRRSSHRSLSKLRPERQ
jgi:hypothetical protein